VTPLDHRGRQARHVRPHQIRLWAAAAAAGAVLIAGTLAVVLGIDSGPTGTPAAEAAAAGTAAPTTGPPKLPAQFASFQKWSDPATWGGTLPAADSTVTIRKDKKILVDVDVPRLKGLVVEGQLAFDYRPTTFRAGYIMVHGRFWMGTEEVPFPARATIVLDGRSKDNLRMGDDEMDNNVFVAMGSGRIDIHGTDEGTSWTRLASTAKAGAKTFTLMEPVGWRKGDLIVVASSDLDFRHKERVNIASVSADGKTVTITAPLKYQHTSVVTTKSVGGSSRAVPERAEVGLLSHNITITGPADAAKTRIGGHIMIMAGSILRLSNAELVHMGQAGRLARYPIHWHFAGDDKGSLVDRVSIRDSFNRMVTIHQTNNVHVNGVVADETLGHGFFFEDGVEHGNVITNNLVMGVRKVPSGVKVLRRSDAVPSEFWVSNPNNTFVNNVAAGGQGAGFWYDFNFNSDNTNIYGSQKQPFGKNENSTAHSHKLSEMPFPTNAVGDGIAIEGLTNDPGKRGQLINPNVWKNENFGLWLEGAITTTNPLAANNGEALTCENTVVEGGLLVGNGTANTGKEVSHQTGLLRFYHGQCDVTGTWLANFKQSGSSSPSLAAISDISASSADFTNRVKGLKFIGGGYRVSFGHGGDWYDYADVDHSHWFADLDGSVVGDGQPVFITNNAPLLRASGDRTLYRGVGRGYFQGASFGQVSALNHGMVRLDLDGATTITRSDGASANGIAPVLITGRKYTIDTGGGGFNFQARGSDDGYVDLVFPWSGGSATVTYDDVNGQPHSAQRVGSLSGGGQYTIGGGKITIRVSPGGDPPFASAGKPSYPNSQQFWHVS
jgi:hypothetical protein